MVVVVGRQEEGGGSEEPGREGGKVKLLGTRSMGLVSARPWG